MATSITSASAAVSNTSTVTSTAPSSSVTAEDVNATKSLTTISSFSSHNPRPTELHSLQIRTKSIEQTLIPLVTQVHDFHLLLKI